MAGRGCAVTAVEQRAGMARGSLHRVLAGRRGRGMRLPTAVRLAKVLGVSVDVFAAALERTTVANDERQRMTRAARIARLEAELGR